MYVGVAQGGVYRSLNGGSNWTPIFDGAQSLAVGALAIAPSSPTTLYVGTGEGNLSGDSFGGVGLYRVDNASTTATLVGPINPPGTNPTASPTTPFTGRSITKIVVSPTDAATVYVSTGVGFAGSGSVFPLSRSWRGIYRSTNATSPLAGVTFTKLAITPATNANVGDLLLDPMNPSRLLASITDLGAFDGSVAGDGGVYLSTNVTAAVPTFTRTLVLPNFERATFAANVVSGTLRMFVATGGNTTGVLRRSDDGGLTWPTTLGGAGFCSTQCWYDIAVAVSPIDSNNILLGGAASLALSRSTNAGVTFAASQAGLHADTHAIAYTPSNANIVYEGNDGGIFKSIDGGATWTSLNNSQFSATQFQSIAVHPTDPNFTIGGSQDNGTHFLRPDGTWTRADYGDGGFALIDQNATDTTNVTMYHTYFNQVGNLMGYARVTNVANAQDASWTFLGCGGVGNGISCTAGSTQFYAPIALGPGNPNTLYYGNDRLYRSSDRGTSNTLVSQVFFDSVTAIGISPQNDNVRIVGLRNGQVFATSTGSATMTEVTGSLPAQFIGRAVIDPSNPTTAYVTLGGFFGNATSHVWKTTNLNAATPTWVALGTGLPDAPTNAFAIDPSNPSRLYAGTDIGVYWSANGGTTWAPYGTGLPVVSVFDMALAKKGSSRTLRIATHGRGMWEIPADFADLADSVATVTAPTVAQVVAKPITISGTASDNVAVSSVEVALYRSVGGGQYWTGSAWQAAYTRVTATLSSSNAPNSTWTYTFNPPETGGVYYATAVAFDSSARFGFSSTVNFSVADTVDPTGSITAPTASQFVAKPVVISGTANDNSTVAGVEIAIYSAGKWWNGSAFQAAYARVPVTMASPGAASTNWSYSFSPPESSGIYAVNALVYDATYRYSFTPYVIFGIPDTVVPSGAITTPAPGAVVSRPVSVTGTATDDVGVASVQVAVFGNGSQWWNGSSWQAAYTRVNATLTAPNAAFTSWTYSFNPPASGTFAINITTLDTSGNYVYSPYQYFFAS